MKIKRSKPAVYNFIRSKLQLNDEDVISLNQYILDEANKLGVVCEPKKIDFISDAFVNMFLNQFDLNVVNQKAD